VSDEVDCASRTRDRSSPDLQGGSDPSRIPIKPMTSISVRPLHNSPSQIVRQIAAKTSGSPWAWMAVTCLLLGISGGIRFWREWQFRKQADASASCPFLLNDLPKRLGSWRAIEGSDAQLEPEVAEMAGSSDHIVRTYVDEKSGEHVVVLVLYGLASTVSQHTPEVCYPAAGYRLLRPDKVPDHQLSMPGSETPIRCRSLVYSKRVGGVGKYEEVYYTFLHNGQWLPDARKRRWKLFRYRPGIFKIQLQRTVSGLTDESPSQALLGELAREITSQIARASAPHG
jgi:hypothetical protein